MAYKTPRTDLQAGMVQLPGTFHGVVTADTAPFFPFPGWAPFTGGGTQKYWQLTEVVTVTDADDGPKTATRTSTISDWFADVVVVVTGDPEAEPYLDGESWTEVSVTATVAIYASGRGTRVLTLSSEKLLVEYEAELLDYQIDAAASLDSFMSGLADSMRIAGVSGSIGVTRHEYSGSSVPSTLQSDFDEALEAAEDAEDAALSALEAMADSINATRQSLSSSFEDRAAQAVLHAKAARKAGCARLMRDYWKNKFDYLENFISKVLETEPDNAQQATLHEYSEHQAYWQTELDLRQTDLENLAGLPWPVVMPGTGTHETALFVRHATWMQAKATRIALEACAPSVALAAAADPDAIAVWFEVVAINIGGTDTFGYIWPVASEVPVGYLPVDCIDFIQLPTHSDGGVFVWVQSAGSLVTNIYPEISRYKFKWNNGMTPVVMEPSNFCANGSSMGFSSISSCVVGRCLVGPIAPVHPPVVGWTELHWADAAFDFGDPAQTRYWYNQAVSNDVGAWFIPEHRIMCAHSWLAEPAWSQIEDNASLTAFWLVKFASYDLNPNVCDLYLGAISEYLKESTPSSPQRYGNYTVIFNNGEQTEVMAGDYGFWPQKRSMVPPSVEFAELLLPPTVLSNAWSMNGTYAEFWNLALVIGDNSKTPTRNRWNSVKVTLSSPLRRAVTMPRNGTGEGHEGDFYRGSLVLPASRTLSGEWLQPALFVASGWQRVMRYLLAEDLTNPRAEWREEILPEGATEWPLLYPVCEFVDRGSTRMEGCYLELVS